MAYVGTFSSPPRDLLLTQVGPPPGNCRGIHIFAVDRATGGAAVVSVTARMPRGNPRPDSPIAAFGRMITPERHHPLEARVPRL